MVNPVPSQVTSVCVQNTSESFSLIEKYRPILVKMLGMNTISKTKELAKDTFVSELWKQLTFCGLGNTKYHWIVANEELQLGYLWAQEDSKFGIAVHWSTSSGWIHKAYLSKGENTVFIESYMVHVINIQNKVQEVSIEDFQSLIEDYFSKHSNPRELISQSSFARKFQRELEQFSIVFKITQSACEKLGQLREMYTDSVLDISVSLGINGQTGKKYNPTKGHGVKLVKISNYFINGRLSYLYEKEGKPEKITAHVAPVIRTWEAFRQVFNNADPESRCRETERTVSKIVSDNVIKEKGLRDLHAWFVLVPGGITTEPYEFVKLEDMLSKEESLELFIDFQRNAWVLQSRFFNKV